MKRISLLTACALLLFFCAGCRSKADKLRQELHLPTTTDSSSTTGTSPSGTSGEETASTTALPDGPSVPELPADITEWVDNETPWQELITVSYDINDMMEQLFLEPYLRFTTEYITVAELHAVFPIQCVRENEDGFVYFVYQIEQGGLLYVFLSPDLEGGPPTTLREWFYVDGNRSYADFSSIEEGDTLEDVKKIDPTVQIYENMMDVDRERVEGMGANSYHYLTDGLLLIGYRYESGEYRIYGTVYLDDYEVGTNRSIGYNITCPVLSIDRVK